MESPVFLQTKLHPTLVGRCLTRARLINELRREGNVRLVLVTGPAGSGKSTILADYLTQSPLQAAWLGLGDEDQDPQVFFNYFLEALCQVFPGSAERTRSRYGSSAATDDFATFFINELLEYAIPVAIVLDDYHLVNQQACINEFLKVLVRRGPANLTILIGSRDQPDLPIPWLRSKRLMAEINQDHLRFNFEETAELFRDIWGQPLDADLVQQLVDRTEGWATGLQLVAQAIRQKTSVEVRSYIQSLQGSEENIFDYLVTEVFQAQSPSVQEFLCSTSIPDAFHTELAQTLAPSLDAVSMIIHLRSSRLFLIALEREGWYRYHHLFGDFLRSKVRQDQGRGHFESLNARAAQWLFEEDEVVAAMPHYLRGNNLEQAAARLEQIASNLLAQGLRSSVELWLGSLPVGLRHSRPGLLVLNGELCDLKGQWSLAVDGYRSALQHYREAGDDLQIANVLEKLSLCYMKYGENKKLLDTCEEGLRLCPDDNAALRSLLQSWLGGCLVNSGEDWARGYELLRSSHTLAYQSSDPRAISWACMFYGFVYHFPQGNFSEALRTLSEGIDFFTRLGWSMIIYQLKMNKALIQVIQGDSQAASFLIDDTLLEARRAGHAFVEKGLEIMRGLCYLESGRLEECRLVLDKSGQAEIPAQIKSYFFRTRLLLHCLQKNFGQARVDCEEMERALIINGSGLYAPECSISRAFLHIQTEEFSEADRRLHENLQLCDRANAKFWEMKTWQMLAFSHFLQGQTVQLKESLLNAFRLTQANHYDIHWLNDSLGISLPLAVAAVALEIELPLAQRVLGRLQVSSQENLQSLLRHPDPLFRRIAVRHLALSSQSGVKQTVIEICSVDPDFEVRSAVRKTLNLPLNSRLQITCLGPLRICMESEDLDFARSLRPLALKVLKYFLASAGQVVSSDQVVETFWPGTEPEKARHNLANQISAIRRALDSQVLFPRSGDGYLLCHSGDAYVDVVEFERCCRMGLELMSGPDPSEGLRHLLKAEQLYGGEFLKTDLYEEWIDLRRRELRDQYDQLLESLGDYFVQAAQPREALARYRSLLEGDELQDRTFHKMLRCYQTLDDRAGAEKMYDFYRERLQESFGLEPQPATRALVESLFSNL